MFPHAGHVPSNCAAVPVTPFPRSFWWVLSIEHVPKHLRLLAIRLYPPLAGRYVKAHKTGSSTLAGVFRNICAHHGITPVKKNKFNPLEWMPDAQAAAKLGELVDAARNATDALEFAIITHLNFSHPKLNAFLRAMDGLRPLLFTAVRHPLKRTYSHFIQKKCAQVHGILGGRQCDRSQAHLNKALEFDTIENRWKFVKQPSMRDYMFNYIRGNATTVEAALAQYDYVFVTERMDEGRQFV